MIGEAQSQGDGRLSYRGPLYAKDAFFDEIDAFLLPTRSEPKGSSSSRRCRGCAVIASARGCIGSYLTAPAGHAIPPSDVFAQTAFASIVAWISEPDPYAASPKSFYIGPIARRGMPACTREAPTATFRSKNSRANAGNWPNGINDLRLKVAASMTHWTGKSVKQSKKPVARTLRLAIDRDRTAACISASFFPCNRGI